MDKAKPLVHVVVGILKREDKVLVCLRPLGKPYNGFWEFPGGKIEENESGRDALERELKEELGIHTLTATPWFTHTHQYPDKTVLLQIWLVEKFSEEPESKEHEEIRWVKFNEIKTLKLLEGNYFILQKMNSIF